MIFGTHGIVLQNCQCHYEYATTTLMTWLGGGSVEYLGGRYAVSVGFAVAAVWESLFYFDTVEDCQALKVLHGISSMASHYL